MTKNRVLLVEDDDATRQLIEQILLDAGYDVVTALDGRHALRLAQATRPDVLVLDLGLPLISGEEFLRHLREFGPAKNIPVVIVSARANALEVAQRLVPATVIPKPFEVDVLVSAVRNALSEVRSP